MLNQDPPAETLSNFLPALPDELERVRLIVEIARRDHAVDAIRARITAEEADQRLIQMQIDDRMINLSPGMAVTVEIKTGSRMILNYLLSPLLRYRQETLRER